MKLLKKWLFPVLTCLIAAGAALLPQRLSLARDARQFASVYAEEMEHAALLPSSQPSSFMDRLALYCCLYSSEHPVLSYEGAFSESGKQSQALAIEDIQQFLILAGLVPQWYFDDEPFQHTTVSRLMLQDPSDAGTVQRPVTFWKYSWTLYDKSHTKTLYLIIDSETALPVRLVVNDTNIARWLPYRAETLEDLAYKYSEALGLVYGADILPEDYLPASSSHLLLLSLSGTELLCRIEQSPTSLTIEPQLRGVTTDAGSFTSDG